MIEKVSESNCGPVAKFPCEADDDAGPGQGVLLTLYRLANRAVDQIAKLPVGMPHCGKRTLDDPLDGQRGPQPFFR